MTGRAKGGARPERPGASTAAIYTLALLTLISAFNYFDRSVLGLVLPLIKRDMRLSDTVLGLVTGFAFALFNVVLTVPIARLADRSSRRNIIAIGLAFWSLMVAVTGMVSNVLQLALVRFLMGAGEAAGVAPSNSMVSDLFGRRRRALTISILTAGNPLGTMAFVPIAGWIAQQYGWRAAFVSAGLPGLVLAALFWLTVREPVRGATDVQSGMSAEGLWPTLRFLLGSRSYIFLLIGGILLNAATALVSAWWPSFLSRTQHMSLGQVGFYMGLVRGAPGLVAIVLGGWLADQLSQKDRRGLFWVPGAAALLATPATLLFLFGSSTGEIIAGLALASLFMAMTQGTAFAACTLLARASMRATSVAVFLFLGYLIGYAVGPLMVGLISDALRAGYGDNSIRYALLTGAACTLVGGLAYLAATLDVEDAIQRATIGSGP